MTKDKILKNCHGTRLTEVWQAELYLTLSLKFPQNIQLPPPPPILCLSWITLTTGQLPSHWIYIQLPTLQPKEDVYCQHVKYGSNRSIAKTRLTCAMLAICFTAKTSVTQVKLRNFVQKGHLINCTEFLQLAEKHNEFWTVCN